MVRFLFQVVAALALFGDVGATRPAYCRNQDGITVDNIFGRLIGNHFTDLGVLTADSYIKAVEIRGERRIDQIHLSVMSQSGEVLELIHGGDGGISTLISLEEDEHITYVEMHKVKHNGKTRLSFLRLVTNKNKAIESGRKTDDFKVFSLLEGHRLLGFQGFSGDEVEGLGPITGNPQECTGGVKGNQAMQDDKKENTTPGDDVYESK